MMVAVDMPPLRPAPMEARAAVHTVFDMVAEAQDSTLLVGRCAKTGRSSRACIAWVRGHGDEGQRWRVTVTVDRRDNLVVRARATRVGA